MKPHRFEPLSFLFGAMPLALALNVLLASDDGRAVDPARFWPTVAVITGITLVGWVAARIVRHGRATEDVGEPTLSPEPDHGSELWAGQDSSEAD